MQLTSRQRVVLKALLDASAQEPSGVNALRFRVKHEDARKELTTLEHAGLIKRDNDKYSLAVLAIAELANESDVARRVIGDCSLMFAALREKFKQDPGRQYLVRDLEHIVQMSKAQVSETLERLKGFSIWGGRSTDLSADDAYVIPSEDILNYKTFDDLVDELRRWARAATALPTIGGAREKHQKFEILDSPTLLASDLDKPCGTLGCAVFFCDLDNFKSINTVLTEVVVDRLVLPSIHRLIRDSIAQLGHAYGEGGDEITMYAPNISLPMAVDLAEAIRQRIEQTSFADAAAAVHATASIGIAYASPEEDRIELRQRASFAKKHAKELGKNRIAVWSHPVPYGIPVASREVQEPSPDSSSH